MAGGSRLSTSTNGKQRVVFEAILYLAASTYMAIRSKFQIAGILTQLLISCFNLK